MNRALLEMQRRTEEFAATLEMLAVEVKRARMREHARQMTKDRVAKRAAAAETEEPDAYRDPERWKSWAAKHLTHNNRRTPTDDQ